MPLAPGSRIGIIGGGQLGRMFALDCRRMDYRTVVLDPDPGCPASQVADRSFPFESLSDFAQNCDLATYEFEHIDIRIVKDVEREVALFPSSSVLEIKQTRDSEKNFLARKGFPVPKFWIFENGARLESLVETTPLVVKLSRGGYDGKGLYHISSQKELEAVRGELNQELVAEQFVSFEKEISVVCARDRQGGTAVYRAVENVHDRGILLTTLAPARISAEVESKAQDIARRLAEELDLIGLLCVELFLDRNGNLLINEFAPRPHNSGHYTMDGCDISQFEMLLRVLCGMPVPQPRLLCPTGMVNILGIDPQSIDYQRLFSIEGVRVHLYGKKEVRERRKIGHVNVLARTADEAERAMEQVRSIVS